MRSRIVLEAHPGELIEAAAERAAKVQAAAGGTVPTYIVHNNRLIPIHPDDHVGEIVARARLTPELPGGAVVDEEYRLPIAAAMARMPFADEIHDGGSGTTDAIADWLEALALVLTGVRRERDAVAAELTHLRTSLHGLGNLIRFATEEAAR